jgi:hypothetical protein
MNQMRTRCHHRRSDRRARSPVGVGNRERHPVVELSDAQNGGAIYRNGPLTGASDVTLTDTRSVAAVSVTAKSTATVIRGLAGAQVSEDT